jgi:NAD(P)-dependent dehydrogenase (short-subunit alcohol dehydrogenase family)
MSIKDKLALVTGAGSGIGRAVCKLFAKEGAVIAAADINTSAAKETVKSLEGSEKHTSFHVDVTRSASVKKLADEVADNFGAVPSIVVHCAGAVVFFGGSLLNCTDNDWGLEITLNLTGTFYVDREFVGRMKENGIKGTVVNFSSTGANGSVGYPGYCAAKAGVEGLTKSIGKEFAKTGIRINAIAPGLTATPLADDLGEEFKEKTAAAIPMGRLGKPEEVAEMALFLSSERSSFITGTVFLCSGGFVR